MSPRTAWRCLRRLGRLGRVLGRHVLSAALGRRGRRLLPGLPPPAPEAERLRSILEEMGGLFLKLGQMLALQPDVLPEAYCRALYDLLDRVPPAPFEEIEGVFRTELGRGPEEVFDRFERRSLASASIGQVHRATLGGRPLVCKVQRPEAEADFAADIRLISGAAALLRLPGLGRFAWIGEHLRELARWTGEELDYRHEARQLVELGLGGRGNPRQRSPEVVAELTTRRVLVMGFLPGPTLLEYLRAREAGDRITARRIAALGFEPRRFAEQLVDNFLAQAFSRGLFHADLHPANLVILPGGAVGYLDLGIVGRLSPFARRQLVAMTLAYARGRLPAMCDALLALSTAPDPAAAEAFRRGFHRLGESWYRKAGGRRRLAKSFTAVLIDMLRLSRRTGVWPERGVLRYIRSLMALDGLMQRFVPGLDLGSYLEKACRRLPHRGPGDSLGSGSTAAARKLVASAAATAAALESFARGELRITATLAAAAPAPWWKQPAAGALGCLAAAFLLGLGGGAEAWILPASALLGWLLARTRHLSRPRQKEIPT